MEKTTFRTIARRPIDTPREAIKAFFEIVLEAGEVPLANLQRGVPMAEMLFFTQTEERYIVGVGAVRYANAAYHKHLFEQAGVPEMYNPYSVESCWIAVRPDYRRQGVWNNNRECRMHYLGNRPCHSVRRVGNKKIVGDPEYRQAGSNFYSKTSEDELRLMVCNHDPVYDPSKRLRYA